MFRALATHPTANLKQLATTRAEQAAYSRLLNNDDTHLDHFIFGIVQDTYRQIRAQACPQLLILNDTTEVNLQAQVGYHQRHGLGVAGNNSDSGFFLHASLAFDPTAKVLIGCAALRVWTRKGGSEDRTDGEARKWFEVANSFIRPNCRPN